MNRCFSREYEPVTNEPAQKMLHTLRCEVESLMTSALLENLVKKVGNELILSGQIEFGELVKKKDSLKEK